VRGAPLIPDELDFVTRVHWDSALRRDVPSLVAGDVDSREVRNRSIVLYATRITIWLGCDVVVRSDLPGKVALPVDFDALEVAVCGDGVGKTQQAQCESAESVHIGLVVAVKLGDGDSYPLTTLSIIYDSYYYHHEAQAA
jgi:hypothetical protein